VSRVSDIPAGIIKVRLLRGSRIIRSYKVRADTFTIGSAKGCTIRAAGDPGLKDRHAAFYIEGDEIHLVPEPGAEVLLNDESVDFAVPGPDDIIKMGRLTMKVELARTMESIVPPAAAEAKPQVPKTPKPLSDPLRSTLSSKVKIPEDLKNKPVSLGKTHGDVPESESDETVLGQPLRREKPEKSAKPQKPEPAVEPAAEPEQEEEKGTILGGIASSSHAAGAGRKITGENVLDPAAFNKAGMSAGAVKHEPVSQPPVPDEEVRYQSLEAGYDDSSNYAYDDEEDDEFTFEEPFDLSSIFLERRGLVREGPKEPYCAAHVIRVKGDRIGGAFGILPGNPYNSPSGDIGARIRGKRLKIEADDEFSGELVKDSHSVDLDEMEVRKGRYHATLNEGDSVLLRKGEEVYKIDVYRPPLVPRPKHFTTSPRFFGLVVMAFVLHAVIGVAVAWVQPKVKKAVEAEKEVFAVVKMNKPDEPAPVEPTEVEDVAPPDSRKMAEKVPQVSQRTIRKRAARRSDSGGRSSVSSLLQVLSRGSGKPGEGNKLKDLISNIDAVSPSKGPGSSFSIAGAIASLPGEGVNIARKGGGGEISTLSGEEIAGKGSGISSLGGRKRSGRIRGKVTKMSSGLKVKGRLSRAEVSRVVNSHIHAIQACYERALMSTPGLSGRVVFDWTVKTNGRVKGVRVRSSTVGSRKVTTCISNLIKKWKFPRPQGGEVTITYPFLFRSVSS